MSTQPPSIEHLTAIVQGLHLHLSPDEVRIFQELIAGTLASYDRVDGLTNDVPRPSAPERTSELVQPQDNAFGAWYAKTSIVRTGRGPLAGKRIVVKDNTAVAGVPMMNGSATLEGYVPQTDATVVDRLLGAGAEIVGKAVCEDLCFSGGSHTPFTGPVRNPWRVTHTSGGSSGGSAALVAAGEVDLAVGGDQGGSVRIPSAFCGTVGIKGTWGLVPYTGAFPIESTLDTLGPIGANVTDVATMLQVMAGRDGHDPRQAADMLPGDYVSQLDSGIHGLKIGIVKEGFGWDGLSDPRVDASVRSAALRLRECGAEVVDISIPQHRDGIHLFNVISIEGAATQMINLNSSGMNVKGLYDPPLVEAFAKGRREHADKLSDTVKLVAMMGTYLIDEYGGAFYAKAQNLAPAFRAAYDAALDEVDVLVMPTLPITASELPTPDASTADKVTRALEMIPNTSVFSVTGHPAMTVPAPQVDGLPVGMMIAGRYHDEATILRVGRAYEQLVGGFMMAGTGRSAAGN